HVVLDALQLRAHEAEFGRGINACGLGDAAVLGGGQANGMLPKGLQCVFRSRQFRGGADPLFIEYASQLREPAVLEVRRYDDEPVGDAVDDRRNTTGLGPRQLELEERAASIDADLHVARDALGYASRRSDREWNRASSREGRRCWSPLEP